jgi:hypothetical protein
LPFRLNLTSRLGELPSFQLPTSLTVGFGPDWVTAGLPLHAARAKVAATPENLKCTLNPPALSG